MRSPFVRPLSCALSLLLTLIASARLFAGGTPLGTAFSYDGVLNNGGSPYSGTADLQFNLYADALGGSPLFGVPVIVTNVTVSNGLFRADVDFGALAFTGEERWLEIGVATPSAGGAGPFTTLTPRQRIAPTPYATYALNAGIAGAQSNAVQFTNPANEYVGSSINIDSGTFAVDGVANSVGVGASPVAGTALRVLAGSGVTNNGMLVEASNSSGNALVAIQPSPTGFAGYFLGRTAFMGNVGINDTNPLVPLLVRGNGGVYVAQGLGYSFYHGATDDSETYGALGANPADKSFFVANLATGPLSFRTGTGPSVASEKMRIMPNGRVGIGTNNPLDALHVASGGVRINQPSATYALIFGDDDLGFNYGGITGEPGENGLTIGAFAAGPLTFQTHTGVGVGFERMRITPAGNVGMGTATPANKLDVEGSVAIGTSFSGSSAAPSNSLIVEGSVGVGVDAPLARVHIGGPVGSAAVRYPDGSVATRAPGGAFDSNSGLPPSSSTQFLANPVIITVTSPSQQFLVQSNRALGSTSPGGANDLNLWIGSRPTGGGSIVLHGGGVLGLTAAQNQRHLFGLSAVISGLAPGTYHVGLVGSSNSPNWNNNEWGYTTAISLN